ncbi:Catechol 2,3-dioxygenase [Evansella caseinilytica]|uniref:Catechol 2,3-dioxygenase n=1 Tax=Evansella caseinilytica TaxID=1503961 RepID=A0A1H3SE60_9BACI|nr:Catechol 2,3-dioxygenase [Evansella caseinilytica]
MDRVPCVKYHAQQGGDRMGFSFKTIDHVQLAAPEGSESRAKNFFTGVLGLEELEKPPALRKRGGVWFRCGSTQIHIGIEEPFSPAKKAHPAFEVENIIDLKKHLTKSGITYIEDDLLPGADRIYVYDPFGNRMELLEWRKST